MISIATNLTAEKFLKLAGPWLEEKEAQNNTFLGIAANIAAKPPEQRQEHHFWVVKQDGKVAGAAFWTPPYKLSLTEMDAEALGALARKVRKSFPHIPGAYGPKEIMPSFIRAWNSPGLQAELEMSARLYRLEKVETVPLVSGDLQIATSKDLDLLTQWCKQFRLEIRASEKIDERALMDSYIQERRLYVWEEGGGIRAMTGCAGDTPHGIRINMVYTPPGLRKRGYASNLVAALSRRMLDSGKKYCVLYTDLLNPTPNSIYQKIGYQPLCDWDGYSFQAFKGLF